MMTRKEIKPEDIRIAMDFYLGLFHPLNRECTLDELTRYVFKYCQEWMMEGERRTTQYLALQSMSDASTNEKNRIYWQNQAKKLWDNQTEVMLKNGEETFLYGVKNRLISNYGNGILNLCPRCGTLARTAQAKQCQKCYHTWHEQLQ